MGGGTYPITKYQRGAYLSEIRYGAHETDAAGYRNAVVFNMKDRCMSNDPNQCLWSASWATPWYLDVPTDLECTATTCSKFAPSFFTKKEVASIDTQVREADVALNGDLDSGAAYVGILPPAGGVTNYAAYSDPTRGQATSGFLETNVTAPGGSVYMDFPASGIAAGSTATATLWVRAPYGGSAVGTLALFALGGTTEGFGQDFVADGTWRQVSVTLPMAAAGHTLLRAQVYEQTAGVNIDIDTVSVHAPVWRTVDRVTPSFDWPDADGWGGNPPQLWLRTLTRTGDPNGAALSTPEIRFESYNALLDNRADSFTMLMWRIDQINDELGGRTTITYGQKNASCTMPTQGWMYNTQDCYPRWLNVDPPQYSGFVTFSRFLVTTVTQTDLTAGATPLTHTYFYEDTALYHHDDSPWMWPQANRTWSEPHGYGQVLVADGNWATEAATLTRHWFFRGMNGDSMGPYGVRSANVIYNDGYGTNITDHPQLRGREYETVVFDQTTNPWTWQEHDAHYYSISAATATYGTLSAYMVFDTTDRHWSNGGSAPTFATETQTTYDAYGFPTQIWDRGDITVATDDTCTSNFWARNSALDGTNLRDRLTRTFKAAGPPTTNLTWAGYCSDNPANELGINDTFYDTQTWGNALATGRPTSTWTRPNATTGVLWADRTVFGYDPAGLGRVISVDGPTAGDADKTFTEYDMYGFANKVTDPSGHVTITLTDPGRNAPIWVNDLNLNAALYTAAGWSDDKPTAYRYDRLGRVVNVFTPDGGHPEVAFTYTISATKTAPATVKTSVEQSNGVMLDSWAFIDGLGRTRETQTVSPAGNRIISGTSFDARSLPVATFANIWVGGVAGSAMWTTGATLPSAYLINETRTAYDNLGRVANTKLFTNNTQAVASNGNPIQTGYTYNGHATTVFPAEGSPTVTRTNALGQTIATDAYNTTWAGAKTTTYSYDLNGHQTQVIDPKGNIRATTYDNLGRQTGLVDPDAGATTYTYNLNNTLATATGPAGALTYTTDVLGRVTQVQNGATVLETYSYDTLAKGLLTSATSTSNGYPFTITIDGYDKRNRPTGYTYTIPTIPGVTQGTGLAGSYDYKDFVYDRADHLISYLSPALGDIGVGLPAETITSTYNYLGNPDTLTGTGAGALVTATAYTGEGRVNTRTLAGTGTTGITRGYTWNQATGQLTGMTATQNTAVLQNDTHSYDALGQLLKVVHTRPSGTDTHAECFAYDGQQHLITAQTDAATTGTGCATPGTGPGGYNQTYAIDEIGNQTAGPAGNYTYPLSGVSSVRPHAPNTAGTTAMIWDAAGRLATQTQPATGGGGGGTATTTTSPATTTTTGGATTTTVGGTCSSATYTWTGYQAINFNNPTFATGVSIPAPASGSTSTVTSMVVQTYDAQSSGTVPTRTTQNETGERVGIRIGTTDVTALTTDLPDVAPPAVDNNYSGVISQTLTGWANTAISGGQIVIRHGSLYTGTTASDSLTAYSVNITVQTCTGGGGGGTTTTTSPATTTTTGGATTTTVGGTCSSATYTWTGYQGINFNNPTFATGVSIPAPASGSTSTVTSMVVQTYDAQSSGTVPTRTTQNETGERVGIRIGTTDVTALTTDLPDVAPPAVDNNYSGVISNTLTGWANTPISGGQIVIRHGSLYTATTASDSLTAYSVNITVQTCTGGGGGGTTTTTSPVTTTTMPTSGTVTTTYTWNPLNQLTQITKTDGTPTEQMWYLPGGERILHKDATGTHLFLGGMAERHLNAAGTTVTEQRFYTLGNISIAVRTKTGATDDTYYTLGDIRGSNTLTIKRNNPGTNQQQWYTAYGTKRTTPGITTTSRGYIGQTSDNNGLNYLHNRYQNATTGIFLTVDPIIQKTGEPYLYAGGNPTTLSDASGLEKGANGEAQAFCRQNNNCLTVQTTRKDGSLDFGDSQWLSTYHKTGGRPGGSTGVGLAFVKTIVQAVVAVAVTTACLAATGGAGVVGCVVAGGAAGRATVSAIDGNGVAQIAKDALNPKAVAIDALTAGIASKLQGAKGAATSATNTTDDALRALSTSEQRAVRSLQQQVADHTAKLEAYQANPGAFDNLGILERAPTAAIRQSIIDGRVRHLNNEIQAFQDQIDKLLGGAG